MSLCLICGRPEHEHHEYQPRLLPDGCKCDDGTWGAVIAPICTQYLGDLKGYCQTCEHDKACHK